jgi:hypothetical protein
MQPVPTRHLFPFESPFANGAQTGAFRYLFNEWTHGQKQQYECMGRSPKLPPILSCMIPPANPWAAKVFIEPDSQPGLYCILPLAPILPPLSLWPTNWKIPQCWSLYSISI